MPSTISPLSLAFGLRFASRSRMVPTYAPRLSSTYQAGSSRFASAAVAEAAPDDAPPPASNQAAPVEDLRLRAIRLYKELHRLGRDYPDPAYGFNKRLRRAFEKNSKTTDPEALKKQLELGEHIKKEVLALISLKKFRHLRRSYHPNEGPR